MAEEKRKTVRVACTITNGAMLQLWQKGFDDGTGDGERMPRKDGLAVRLNGPSALHTGAGATHRADVEPGVTEVDAEWWGKWLDQNKLNPAVDSGAIREVKEDCPLP